MRKVLAIIFLTIAFTPKLFSQDKMIINKPGGITYYDDFSKDISSLNRLPRVIRYDVQNLIKTSMGELSSNLSFSNGQIVNIKRYFAHDNDAVSYMWILPKYDLNFNLRDTTLGFENYTLNIRVDKYGQIIGINWPRKGFNFKSVFISRDTIKTFAFKEAKRLKFNLTNYKVQFDYNEKEEKFSWRFLFPLYPEINTYYNCIEVNWADINDYKVYPFHQNSSEPFN